MAHHTFKIVLMLHVALLISFASSQKDDTLTDFANGKDVTEATIRKIFNSQIFPNDHSFLIRLAYVESRFGTDNSTFRPNYNGGIWQVDEDAFDATKSTSLTPLHQAIFTNFHVNWTTDVTWKSCLAPLYSALSTALYFNQISIAIPDRTNNQASHWKSYYRPEGNETKFIQDSEELRNDIVCRGKIDLAIALDGSGSVSTPDFYLSKNFVADMITTFTLHFTRIGMLVYSINPTDIFWVENNLTIVEMEDIVRKVEHDRGAVTSIDQAIMRGIRMHNNASRIDGIPRILILFTDGRNNGPELETAIDLLERNKITSVAIGIGDSFSYDELVSIALNETRRVFTLSDFSALQDFLPELRSSICEIPQKPLTNGIYDDGLIKNEKRIYELSIPATGLTVTLDVTTGQTIGYWSRTERVPNSAVHDGIIDGVAYIPDGATVYVTVEGLEPMNTYTFQAAEGNH